MHFDASPRLRDLKPAGRPFRAEPEPRLLLPRTKAHQSAQPQQRDPVVQSTPGPLVNIPATVVNFDGIGDGVAGFTVNAAPPDTNLAVGPNHLVQVVNTDVAVYNKSGALLFGPVAINTLWAGFGGLCQADNNGDPVVRYDAIADRFLVTQFAVTNPYLECVAVSQTPDPTGAYYRYAFSFTQFDDYPKLAVWPDAYYMTYNLFDASSNFVTGTVCAMDRSKMLVGQAATQQCFDVGIDFGGLLPSDFSGTRLPPAGAPNHVLALGAFDGQLAFWNFHVDFTNSAKTTLTGPTVLNTAAYTLPCGNTGGACISQSGGNVLDTLGDRLMFRLVYRNFGDHESLVTNHSVDVNGPVGERWYELRLDGSGNPSIFQQSTYAPDSNSRWMGSIAIDQAGNLGMGYSVSSSALHPQIRYTGRLATDPLNTMAQGEGTLFAGNGSQFGRNLSRWGDYSSIDVDPSDGCTFWYTTEYIPANGSFNWRTRIASFKFPSCGGASAPIMTKSAGDGQSATTGQPFAIALQVVVKDSNNNPVPGATVTFTAPASGPSGTFAGGLLTATAATNPSGFATAPTFTANATGGSYGVSATLPGVTPVSFSLTNNSISSAPPTADSVTPNTGSGASQTFTFKYSSANGYQYLTTAYALINSSLSGSGGCIPVYLAATNALYLYNDAGTALLGPLTPGAAGSLSNSQCTVNLSGSSATGSVNTLSLALALVFNPAFKGTQTVYGYVADKANSSSGWKTLGTWVPNAGAATPPTADSVTPNTGSGASQTFTFKFSSASGYQNISSTWAVINGSLSASGGCVPVYLASGNALYLYNDAGTAFTGPMTPGTAGSLSNSQCTINVAASPVTGLGNTLSMTLAVTFSASFKGTQTLFGYVADNANMNSGWKTLGTWVTNTGAPTPPTADSVTPNTGSGGSQTFTFKFSSASGYQNINSAWALINGSLSGAGGCIPVYLAAGNGLYLLNDSGSAFTGPITPGAAGSLSNSQCTINGATSPVTGSGNTLSMVLAITFNPTFKGTQTLFGYVADNANMNSGWKSLGTWTTF